MQNIFYSFQIFFEYPISTAQLKHNTLTSIFVFVIIKTLHKDGVNDFPMGSTLRMVCKGVHLQRIISNVVLLFSLSPILMLNELQRRHPNLCSMAFYIVVMRVLSFGSPFQCFHVSFRSKHSEFFLR